MKQSAAAAAAAICLVFGASSTALAQQPRIRSGGGLTQLTGTPVELPAGQARLRFFHRGAALAAGINLKGWRESGAFDKLADQLKAAGVPGAQQPMALLPMLAGIEQVWVVIDGVQPGSARAAKEPQPLLLLTGSFTDPLWEQILNSAVPLSQASAVLVGKPAAVAAMKRRLRLAAPLSQLAAEAAELSKTGDFWLAGIPGLLPNSAKKAAAGAPPEMLASIKQFSISLQAREKLDADLKLTTSTPKAAEQLLGLYRLVEMQQLSGGGKDAELVAKSLKAEQIPSGLRFRLSVDPKDLTPLVAQRMRAGSAAPAERAANNRKIVIQGLESGPREIPLDGHR